MSVHDGWQPTSEGSAALLDSAGQSLDAVGTDRPMLIGHSMGTQVVVEMALPRPETEQIALLAPTVNATERTVHRQALRLIQECFSEPWKLKAIMANDYLRCGITWWAKTLREMMGHRIEERLPHMTAGGLLVAGESDPTSPPAWARELDDGGR